MHIVLDTNVWLVIIPLYSKYAGVYTELKSKESRFKLILNQEILLEYEEQMKYRYDDIFVDNEIKELLLPPNVEQVETWFKWNLITQDPDDNKFIDCAIAGNADYIVTNDKHFNIREPLKTPLALSSLCILCELCEKKDIKKPVFRGSHN